MVIYTKIIKKRYILYSHLTHLAEILIHLAENLKSAISPRHFFIVSDFHSF